VVASLLVSVVLLGFKSSALKRLVGVAQRRSELLAALASLQPKLEEEDLAVWLDDVEHDTAQRQARIREIGLASDHVYSATENVAIERCQGMLARFNPGLAIATSLKVSAVVTKYDETSRLLCGRAEAEIRAHPLDIIGYLLNPDSRHFKSLTAARPNFVRSEVVEVVHPYHTIVFHRFREQGIQDRTFLNSVVAKQVADDPRTFVVAVVPIPSHHKIGPKDEKRAVRGENCMSFRLTEVASCVVKLECSRSLDMKGWVPQSFTNRAIPRLMSAVPTFQHYFQQLRPLSECGVEDGYAVGHMLVDVVKLSPNDRAHAVRTVANRTVMLQECGMRHIGAMLAHLLTTDSQDRPGPVEELSMSVLKDVDISLLTEKQAIALGSLIASSVYESNFPVTALQKVVKLNTLLRAMKSAYVWFVPMLEIVSSHKAAKRSRREGIRRFSAKVWAGDAMSNTDGADEESGFKVVVCLAISQQHTVLHASPGACGEGGHWMALLGYDAPP
jgi:hypothetical protein